MAGRSALDYIARSNLTFLQPRMKGSFGFIDDVDAEVQGLVDSQKEDVKNDEIRWSTWMKQQSNDAAEFSAAKQAQKRPAEAQIPLSAQEALLSSEKLKLADGEKQRQKPKLPGFLKISAALKVKPRPAAPAGEDRADSNKDAGLVSSSGQPKLTAARLKALSMPKGKSAAASRTPGMGPRRTSTAVLATRRPQVKGTPALTRGASRPVIRSEVSGAEQLQLHLQQFLAEESLRTPGDGELRSRDRSLDRDRVLSRERSHGREEDRDQDVRGSSYDRARGLMSNRDRDYESSVRGPGSPRHGHRVLGHAEAAGKSWDEISKIARNAKGLDPLTGKKRLTTLKANAKAKSGKKVGNKKDKKMEKDGEAPGSAESSSSSSSSSSSESESKKDKKKNKKNTKHNKNRETEQNKVGKLTKKTKLTIFQESAADRKARIQRIKLRQMIKKGAMATSEGGDGEEEPEDPAARIQRIRMRLQQKKAEAAKRKRAQSKAKATAKANTSSGVSNPFSSAVEAEAQEARLQRIKKNEELKKSEAERAVPGTAGEKETEEMRLRKKKRELNKSAAGTPKLGVGQDETQEERIRRIKEKQQLKRAEASTQKLGIGQAETEEAKLRRRKQELKRLVAEAPKLDETEEERIERIKKKQQLKRSETGIQQPGISSVESEEARLCKRKDELKSSAAANADAGVGQEETEETRIERIRRKQQLKKAESCGSQATLGQEQSEQARLERIKRRRELKIAEGTSDLAVGLNGPAAPEKKGEPGAPVDPLESTTSAAKVDPRLIDGLRDSRSSATVAQPIGHAEGAIPATEMDVEIGTSLSDQNAATSAAVARSTPDAEAGSESDLEVVSMIKVAKPPKEKKTKKDKEKDREAKVRGNKEAAGGSFFVGKMKAK